MANLFFALLLAVYSYVAPVAPVSSDEESEVATVSFLDQEYRLAFQSETEGLFTNEYLLEGESLEQWTSMIAVRKFSNISEVKAITGPYLEQLKPLMVRDAEVYARDGDRERSDVVLEVYLAPADHSYLEYNLLRFVEEEGEDGVKFYQFAIRTDFDVDAAVESNTTELEARINALGDLQVAIVEEDSEDDESNDDDTNEDAAAAVRSLQVGKFSCPNRNGR